jgi:hypothetical protein
VKPCLNVGGPPSKPKYSSVTDSEEYREGKVKSTPMRGVKQILKPDAYKQSKEQKSEFRSWESGHH